MSIFPSTISRSTSFALPAIDPQKLSRLLGSAGLSFLIYAFLTHGEPWIIFFPLIVPGLVSYAVLREEGYRADVVLVPFLGLLVRATNSPLGKKEFKAVITGVVGSLAASFVYALMYQWSGSKVLLHVGLWSAYATLMSLMPVLPLQGGVLMALLTEKVGTVSQAFLILLASIFVFSGHSLLTTLPALLACGWLQRSEVPAPLVCEERSGKMFIYLGLCLAAALTFAAYVFYI
jgi:hypothetical protein